MKPAPRKTSTSCDVADALDNFGAALDIWAHHARAATDALERARCTLDRDEEEGPTAREIAVVRRHLVYLETAIGAVRLALVDDADKIRERAEPERKP